MYHAAYKCVLNQILKISQVIVSVVNAMHSRIPNRDQIRLRVVLANMFMSIMTIKDDKS